MIINGSDLIGILFILIRVNLAALIKHSIALAYRTFHVHT